MALDDSAQRKKTEEALIQSEERYRLLIETTGTGYVIIDTRGVVLDANLEYVRLSGHEKLSEILGRSVVEWTSENEKEVNALAVAACLKNGMIRNFEVTYFDKTGKHTPIEINAAVLEADGHRKILTLCRDITQRKQMEAALRRSETLFASAFRISPAATILSRLHDGTCIDANEAYARLLGYSRSELLGKTTMELKIWLSPEERAKATSELARAGRLSNVPITLRKKDGSLCSTMASAEILAIEGVQCILSFFYDVTEIRKAGEDLKKASRLKDEFIANMSHEIRTPMTPIKGYADLLLETKLTPEQRTYAQTIESSSQKLLYLLNDIIDISRIEAGHLTLEKGSFELSGLLTEVKTLFEKKINGEKITFSIDHDPAISSIVSDQRRLRQILVNFISNAVKFTDKGAITMASRISKNGKTLHVSVADTGIGIPEKMKEAIFDKFVQVDSSSTRRHSGAGLGLAISKKLAELMKGEITLETRQKKGSVFTLCIPYIKTAD